MTNYCYKILIILLLGIYNFGTKADSLRVVRLHKDSSFVLVKRQNLTYFATSEAVAVEDLHQNSTKYFRKENQVSLEAKDNWLRFELDNQQENQYFGIDAAQNWNVEVYVFEEKSLQARKVAYGIDLPISQRTFSFSKWYVPVQLTKGKHTIYVRYRNSKDLAKFCDCKFDVLGISVIGNAWYFSVWQYGYYALILGILLIMTCYNAIIYYFIKDKIYLHYVLGCLFFMLFFALSKSVDYMHWFLEKQAIANNFLGFSNTSISISVFFLYKFAENYLAGIVNAQRKWFRFFKNFKYTLLIINLPINIFTWLSFVKVLDFDTYLWININNINYALVCLVMIFTSWQAWKSGNTLGKYFVYANLLLFIAALVELLSNKYLKVYEGNFLTYNALSIGFAFQLTAFSLALAQRIQSLRKQVLQQQLQQEKTEKEHLENMQKLILVQNEELERKVTERTFQLEQSNEEIRTQASTIQKQAEAMQEANSRELMNKTLQILQKNEALNDILKFIEKIKPHLQGEEEKNYYKSVARTIKENIDADKQWEDFKEYFEKVYPTLFSEMYKLCPTLTQNDLRLCAYMKMGLNRKEIAQMLNINVESVRKHIYRLKLKLGADVEAIDIL